MLILTFRDADDVRAAKAALDAHVTMLKEELVGWVPKDLGDLQDQARAAETASWLSQILGQFDSGTLRLDPVVAAMARDALNTHTMMLEEELQHWAVEQADVREVPTNFPRDAAMATEPIDNPAYLKLSGVVARLKRVIDLFDDALAAEET